MNTLFSQAIYHVVAYGASNRLLSLVDIWNARVVCRDGAKALRAYNEETEYPFLDRLLMLVGESHRDVISRMLVTLMRDYGAVIAGSSPLWCVVENSYKWCPQDIDVVLDSRRGSESVRAMRFMKELFSEVLVYAFSITHYANAEDMNEAIQVSWPKYKYDSFHISKIDVIIPAENRTAKEHICATIDFSACTTRFMWSMELQKVVMRCPKAKWLVQKEIHINHNGVIPINIIQRIEKYERRGFEIKSTPLLPYIIAGIHAERTKMRKVSSSGGGFY